MAKQTSKAIYDEALRMAKGGVDFRTIEVHLTMGGPLDTAGADALTRAWHASKGARAKRYNAKAQRTADSLRS